MTVPVSCVPTDVDGEAAALVLSLAVALFVDEVVGPTAAAAGDGPDRPAAGS